MQNKTAYLATLTTATFLMASSFVAGKILLQKIPPLALVGWRFILAAAALAAIAAIVTGRPPLRLMRTRQWSIVVLIGVLQTAATMGLMFLALRRISPAATAIIVFTNPLWVALLGRLFLGEALTGIRLLGLLLGIVGVGMALGVGALGVGALGVGALGVGALSGEADLLGELFALGSSLAWASATIVNKRYATPLPSWWLSFAQTLVGALLLLVLAAALGERWPDGLDLSDWGWFAWLSIPGSALSFGMWFLALRMGGATRSSAYLFLAPFFTVLLSALILGMHVTLLQALGGVAIGLGLWLVNRS
jgi:drug/metabolite transporter (DMT)-like permease